VNAKTAFWLDPKVNSERAVVVEQLRFDDQ
jgi:hypothetical protein